MVNQILSHYLLIYLIVALSFNKINIPFYKLKKVSLTWINYIIDISTIR